VRHLTRARDATAKRIAAKLGVKVES
jgi:hypothetical protein